MSKGSSSNFNNNLVVPSEPVIIYICVLGEPKSGKTTLIDCFLTETFSDKNYETIINVTKAKINIKNLNLELHLFDLGGYMDRDREILIDYIKSSNIILLCHSFETDFNEENIKNWLDFIEQKSASSNKSIYLVGCKYDLKIMLDYQKGSKITSLMFANDNLTSFGERIKTFINNPHNNLKGYYMASSLLNFNVREMFQNVVKDWIYDNIISQNLSKGNQKDNQNCLMF